MNSIRAILVPTDFSQGAEYAFSLACSIARDHDAGLLVLHVALPQLSTRDQAEKQLERWCHELLGQPARAVPIKRLLRQGDPATEIAQVAKECRCDLIVMGTHSWVRGNRLLMGSVAHEVFSRAECLLLIARPPLPHSLAS